MRPIHAALSTLMITALVACATSPSRVTIYPSSSTDTTASSVVASSDSVIVAKGDTLYSIARKRGVAVKDLAAWNCLSAPYLLQPGQQLVVKAERKTCAATMPLTDNTTTTATKTTVASTTSNAVQASDTSPFLWPAEGRVTTLRNADQNVTGIDIASKEGSVVRAAADGVVLYSGAGSPGLEEVIVIKHDGGWVSSYAHNRQRLVAEGKQVTSGTPIAEMGNVGLNHTALRFELRRAGQLVDPTAYLPSR